MKSFTMIGSYGRLLTGNETGILLSEIKRLQLTSQRQGPIEASSHKIISTVLILILWIVS